MLHDGTSLGHMILDFYSDKGIDCSVVDEHSSLLVRLSADGGRREFRCGRHAFTRGARLRNFYLMLEREYSQLEKESRSGRD